MKKNDFFRIILFVIISIFFVSSISIAQENNESFKTIKIYVQYNLAKDGLLDENDISVDVDSNNLFLNGMVKTIADKNEAAEDAESVSADFSVINNLKIASTNLSPDEIVKDVMNNIYNNTFYGIFDYVTASYNNGVLTLSGYVHLPWFINTFQKEAEKVPGILEIKNEIKKTFGPGRIGIMAARYVYSDPAFQGYAFSVNPPIHIIVNNGSVLLFGKVNSEIESSMAANLIRFKTDAFDVINNLSINSSSKS